MKDYQKKLFNDADRKLSELHDRVWGAFSPKYPSRDLVKHYLNQARIELTKLKLEVESEDDRNEL